MMSHRYLPIIAAIAVTLCRFNCLITSAKAAGFQYRAAQAAAAGLNNLSPEAPPKCMNESGCICRGAIFIAAPQVDALDLTTWIAVSQAAGESQRLPKLLLW